MGEGQRGEAQGASAAACAVLGLSPQDDLPRIRRENPPIPLPHHREKLDELMGLRNDAA